MLPKGCGNWKSANNDSKDKIPKEHNVITNHPKATLPTKQRDITAKVKTTHLLFYTTTTHTFSGSILITHKITTIIIKHRDVRPSINLIIFPPCKTNMARG